VERQYVGIDLHRRRSVIVRMNEDGEELSTVRIENDPIALSMAVAEAGPNPEVVLEACYGWYWAVDVLLADGAKVHLVHPAGLDWGNRRVKNDERDAMELANRLRRNDLPEAWIAPPKIRQLREAGPLPGQARGSADGSEGPGSLGPGQAGPVPAVDLPVGPEGEKFLNDAPLDPGFLHRLESLRDLVTVYNKEVDLLEREIYRWLRDDPGYWAIQQLNGVGHTLAAIFVAEIGDISRFPGPQQLCSWAGMTPKHRESDVKVRRGKITKQGSVLVRWAAVEAISHVRGTEKIKQDYHRIAERRGKNIARVAAARKLLTLVYYGLRDGEIRCLAGHCEAG